MSTLDAVRDAVCYDVDEETGEVRQTSLRESYNLFVTIGEVTSLVPPRVEILNGDVVRVRAYVGAQPQLGDMVVMLKMMRFWVAIAGVTVV